MALTYTCERPVIEVVLESLKSDGLVAGDTYFNRGAPQQLRREVAYRDFDFLARLSRIGELETVGSVLKWLEQNGLVPEGATYDEQVIDVERV